MFLVDTYPNFLFFFQVNHCGMQTLREFYQVYISDKEGLYHCEKLFSKT